MEDVEGQYELEIDDVVIKAEDARHYHPNSVNCQGITRGSRGNLVSLWH